jgi:aminopeptidase N
MIVATSDFNMGAMENKGLNIFNTKYVLANQATATDTDYGNIESVVGHEYFHNWTGNRITCRDWFQLSLKEGLTVFRDQEFSQDLSGSPSARAVKRIEDVRVLRTAQFPEDAGPMAHPVRPDQYLEINNFYTVTIYEKGAEVVRMMQTLVGREGFTKGVALYFQRFDGQAVTCDDFAQAIADANPDSQLAQKLDQFKRWYSQSGTPRLKVTTEFDATGMYKVTLTQSCAPTPGQPDKLPFVIPVGLGLLDAEGSELTGGMHVLTQESETLTFPGYTSEPVPSLLRGFSAPVILEYDYSDRQLLTLLAHDTDPFNRWEAGQRLATSRALAFIRGAGDRGSWVLDEAFLDAMRSVLRHPDLDAAFKELVLTLPGETYIAEQLDVADPQRIHQVREAMREQLATALHADWEQAIEANQVHGAYSPDAVSSGRRALAGLALTHLCIAARSSGDTVWPGRAYQRFKDASNMTDRFNALAALVTAGSDLAAQALQRFHAMFKDEPLVLDKWFALQAGAPDRGGNVLPLVKQLMNHADFNIRNPNRARSVIFSYCSANPGGFHRSDAAGYVFWSDRVIELDGINPQVAARLARALDRWKKLAEPQRSAAREAIARVAAKPDLSNDVREVVTRALAD